MILNIFGPSGSGKTTLIKDLLKNNKILIFFEMISKERHIRKMSNEVSISLIPLPKFRGTIKDFFNIFSIDINILLSLDEELSKLSESIFAKINNRETLNEISLREIDTFSAGELRRLFILKSLLVNSPLLIIDEPFSNSDEKLWDIIFKSFSIYSNVIILSHIPLNKNFIFKDGDLSINIVEARDRFYN
tara:strand:- start:409 stop:978 length:570 start_codon:yes stop_codon:yes gene_type:complete